MSFSLFNWKIPLLLGGEWRILYIIVSISSRIGLGFGFYPFTSRKQPALIIYLLWFTVILNLSLRFHKVILKPTRSIRERLIAYCAGADVNETGIFFHSLEHANHYLWVIKKPILSTAIGSYDEE